MMKEASEHFKKTNTTRLHENVLMTMDDGRPGPARLGPATAAVLSTALKTRRDDRVPCPPRATFTYSRRGGVQARWSADRTRIESSL